MHLEWKEFDRKENNWFEMKEFMERNIFKGFGGRSFKFSISFKKSGISHDLDFIEVNAKL